MPIKRIKKVKKTKETIKTVAKAKKKGQAQAQTNVQKVSIRIGGEPKGKKEEQRSIVVAPTVAPVFHTRTGLSEAHFMHPYPQVKTGNPVLMEQGIKKEQYINNHSGVVLGGNQQQRLLTPSDVFAHSIQPIANFSQVKQPSTLDFQKLEEEDHKDGAPEPEQILDGNNPGAMPNGQNPITSFFKPHKPEVPKGKPGPRSEGAKGKQHYIDLIKDWNQQQEDIDQKGFTIKGKGIEELKAFVRDYGLE